MKFYNREEELRLLGQIRNRSAQSSKMTVITGRRRIGKTRLIMESLQDQPYLYFFIARKEERLLCEGMKNRFLFLSWKRRPTH